MQATSLLVWIGKRCIPNLLRLPIIGFFYMTIAIFYFIVCLDWEYVYTKFALRLPIIGIFILFYMTIAISAKRDLYKIIHFG